MNIKKTINENKKRNNIKVYICAHPIGNNNNNENNNKKKEHTKQSLLTLFTIAICYFFLSQYNRWIYIYFLAIIIIIRVMHCQFNT